MIRMITGGQTADRRLPRTRGDDPARTSDKAAEYRFAPHARG